MASFMSIFLHRKNGTPRNDDKIRIHRVDGNLVVQHYDADGGIRTRTVLTRTGLVGYLSTLTAMVRDDCDPFEFIQFNFPGLPIVLYSAARLHNPDVMRTIKDAARITSDSWFRDMADTDSDTESDASSTTATSTDSEDEYADMPPLIPVGGCVRFNCPCD